MKTANKAPKGAPTSLNLSVLAKLMGGAAECPNEMGAPDVPHMRRCFKAGLVTVDGRTLRLTVAGREALAAEAA